MNILYISSLKRVHVQLCQKCMLVINEEFEYTIASLSFRAVTLGSFTFFSLQLFIHVCPMVNDTTVKKMLAHHPVLLILLNRSFYSLSPFLFSSNYHSPFPSFPICLAKATTFTRCPAKFALLLVLHIHKSKQESSQPMSAWVCCQLLMQSLLSTSNCLLAHGKCHDEIPQRWWSILFQWTQNIKL